MKKLLTNASTLTHCFKIKFACVQKQDSLLDLAQASAKFKKNDLRIFYLKFVYFSVYCCNVGLEKVLRMLKIG